MTADRPFFGRTARRTLLAMNALIVFPPVPFVPSSETSEPASALVEVSGLLRDAAGAPIANVFVFGAEDGSDRMSAFAVSGADGRVVLRLPRKRHNFGVSSSRYGVANLAYQGPLSFVMELRPLPPGAPEGGGPLRALPLVLGGAKVIRGRVTDQTGKALVGVRVEALRGDRSTAAAAVTDAQGRFAIGLVGGRFHLRSMAPGLKVAKASRRDDHVEIVMEVDAQAEQVSVQEGHVLRFRLDRSLDPEIFPPAPVRAWLCWSYGIRVRSRTPTNAERKSIKKYWYLDVLRNPPPNPAKVTHWGPQACSPEADEILGGRPFGPAAYSRPLIERIGEGTLPSSIYEP
jgi:hypothetical protein